MGKQMPRHGRRDSNETEIVKALRGIGAQVYKVNMAGLPDLIVNFNGQTYFMEDKTKRGKLTDLQAATFSDWSGSEIHIVRSIEDAYAVLGAQITA